MTHGDSQRQRLADLAAHVVDLRQLSPEAA